MKVAITTEPRELSAGWHAQPVTKTVIDVAGLDELRLRLDQPDPAWLIVTSPRVFSILAEHDIEIPDHILIACLGPGTAKTAPRADFVGPQPASARAFVDAFDPGGLPMIFPASALAGPVIESIGAARITIYSTEASPENVAALQGYDPDVVIVTASSAARAIATCWRGEYPQCVAIGSPTATTLRECGIDAVMADEPTRAGLEAALERMR